MQVILSDNALTILLLIGWFLVIAGVGRLFLGWTAIGFFSRGEALFLSFGIGLVMTGYAVFILGITQSLYPGLILSILTILTLLAIAGWRRPLCQCPAPSSRRSRWDTPAAWLLAVVLFTGFLFVLTPEIGKDALIYHLAAPKLYLQHRGFYLIPGNVFASYPFLGEMHYVLALFLKDDILAKAINYTVLCGILLGIGLLARFLMREHAFPVLSMLIFASIPSVFFVSHLAYNDLFVTFFTLAAVYAFLRWSEEGAAKWLIVCGFFSGSAAACKYTALLLTPLGCLGVLWLMNRQQAGTRQTLHRCALFVSAAFIAGGPFYLKNWIVTGNPFYPFMYGIFGGVGWDADQARIYDIFVQNLGMGRRLKDYLLLPWNLSFHARADSPQFDGILGPIFILTLPFLIGKRQWEITVRVLIVYAIMTFLFWASAAQQIRYLIPLLAILAIVIGTVLTRYRNQKSIFALLMLVIAGSLLFNGYHIFREFLKVRPFAVTVGLESRDKFLARMIPTYSMYRFVNQQLPPESRVFLIYMKNYTFLCKGDCYSDSMFEAHTLQKILRQSSSPEQIHSRLTSEGFTHLLYDEMYLLGNLSPLTPEEINLFVSFRGKQCSLIMQSGSYRLERLNPAATGNRGLP
jgi:hypothetical protein